MASQQSPLPISVFQTPDGAPVANGYLVIYLSKDCATPSGGQVGTVPVTVQLNEDGAIIGSPQFWQNSVLTPSDSIYVVKVYESTGELVSNYQLNIVVGNSPSATGFGRSFGTSFSS